MPTWIADGGKFQRRVSGNYRWYMGEISQDRLDELHDRLSSIGKVELGERRQLTALRLTPKVAILEANILRIEKVLDDTLSPEE